MKKIFVFQPPTRCKGAPGSFFLTEQFSFIFDVKYNDAKRIQVFFSTLFIYDAIISRRIAYRIVKRTFPGIKNKIFFTNSNCL